MLRNSVIVATVCSLLGCGSENQGDEDASSPTFSAGAISCTAFYRRSYEAIPEDPSATTFIEQSQWFEPNEQHTLEIEKLQMHARFSSDRYEGNVFSLAIRTAETPFFSSLYQFGRSLPTSQLNWDHGFTGLIFLTHPTDGGDYQFICETVPD